MSRKNILKFPGHRCRGSEAQYAALPEEQKRVVDAFNRAFASNEEFAKLFTAPKKVRS